jgi:hypothetical protein
VAAATSSRHQQPITSLRLSNFASKLTGTVAR